MEVDHDARSTVIDSNRREVPNQDDPANRCAAGWKFNHCVHEEVKDGESGWSDTPNDKVVGGRWQNDHRRARDRAHIHISLTRGSKLKPKH